MPHVYKIPLVLTTQPEGGYTVTSSALPEAAYHVCRQSWTRSSFQCNPHGHSRARASRSRRRAVSVSSTSPSILIKFTYTQS